MRRWWHFVNSQIYVRRALNPCFETNLPLMGYRSHTDLNRRPSMLGKLRFGPARRWLWNSMNPGPQLKSLHVHIGLHGHSWAQEMLRVLPFFEKYLYRNSLHDLDVIPRGIFRRQQAVACATGAGDAIDVSIVSASISVNRDLHVLARPHFCHLGFFEIGSYPNVLTIEGSDGHELLPGRNVLARLNRSL